MVTKVTYVCDYCGQELKNHGRPLTITVTTNVPYMTSHFADLCDGCSTHITQQLEEFLERVIGDSCVGG